MIRSIPIGSKVICTNDSGGRSAAMIVDRATRSITHVAAVEKSLFHGGPLIHERLANTIVDDLVVHLLAAEKED